MKTIFVKRVLSVLLGVTFLDAATMFCQDETLPCNDGKPELGIYVYDMPKPQRDSGLIIMNNISTCWGSAYSSPLKKFLPLSDNDTLCKDTSYLIEICSSTSDTILKLYGEGWDYPTQSNVFYSFGKYKFYVGYLRDSINLKIVKYDSIMIDFTDSNYDRRAPCYEESGPNAVDYRLVYFWGSKTWTLVYPIQKTLDWEIPIIVWDSTFGGPCVDLKPRVTNCFTPAPPKDFTLGSSSGSPYLSWSSNGETFPIRYKIYRKLNNKYGTYTNIADTTSTHYTDTEISCTGYGSWTAYYYVLAKNNSSGSDKVSSSTDTLDILYNCVSKESAGNDDNLSFALLPNYPNPFNPSTEISYQLPSDEYVSLKIYNTLGQEVRTLVRETQYTGLHKVIWDGKNRYGQIVPSGVYLYRLETKSFTKTMKMIMMK